MAGKFLVVLLAVLFSFGAAIKVNEIRTDPKAIAEALQYFPGALSQVGRILDALGPDFLSGLIDKPEPTPTPAPP